jgi:hypothetical protein
MGDSDKCCAKSKEPGIQKKASDLLGMANDIENMTTILHDRLYGAVPDECCDKANEPTSLNDVLFRCLNQLSKARRSLRDALDRL